MSRPLIMFGLLLVVIGVTITIVGALLGAFGGRGGRLPGDLVISRPGFTLYVPIVTSILLSVVLTLILWAISAWRR